MKEEERGHRGTAALRLLAVCLAAALVKVTTRM